jgi:FtsZ-interacting cell division protein ZipA
VSLFLIVLCAAVVLLLGARWFKNKGTEGSTSEKRRQPSVAKSATRNNSRSRKFGLSPLSAGDLDFQDDGQVDALASTASLSEPETASQGDAPSPLLVIHAVAEGGKPYQGYDLLQALLANNLRFGDRKIFHRYGTGCDSASPIYSVTSLNKPGTFDLPKMGSFSCDGLIFFAQLDQIADPVDTCQMMLDAAEKLVGTLGGSLADEGRIALSADAVAKMREQASYYGRFKTAAVVNE